jgi:redox-sensitive bicupin YhaK (pirin superfamily)
MVVTPGCYVERMLEALLVPRTRELGGGFTVRRTLPAAKKRALGPFVFFDQMGPVALAPGRGLDVRPHPHIGLATVTYLFEGEILHRDSVGSVQAIRPGDVNWMTAGRGIAHSERTPPAVRAAGSRVSGIQLWVGLPRSDEETAPRFEHVSAARLPVVDGVRIILGEWRGARSPVAVLSPMLYADAPLERGASLELDLPHSERALYVAEGEIEHDGASYAAGSMLVFALGTRARVSARSSARALLLAGEPLDGERFVWWNFVASTRARIARAAEDWKEGRFAAIPGETEFIPLPDNAPRIADIP